MTAPRSGGPTPVRAPLAGPRRGRRACPAWLATRSALALAAALAALAAAPPARAADGDEAAARRAIGIVQKRLYPKAGRGELAAFTGWLPSDAFLQYIPIGLRGAYHFTEHWALEGSFAWNFAIDTALRQRLEDQDAAARARIRDRQKFRLDADVLLTPFYGKLAATGRRVAHLEIFFLAGGGIVYTGESEVGIADGVRPEIDLGAGIKFFAARRMTIRLEARDHLYWAPSDPDGNGGGVAQAWEISLGVGVLLGRAR